MTMKNGKDEKMGKNRKITIEITENAYRRLADENSGEWERMQSFSSYFLGQLCDELDKKSKKISVSISEEG